MVGELDVYLGRLFGRARPATLVEVRWRALGAEGMRRTFVPAGQLAQTAEVIERLDERGDVFVGVLPRWRRGGRRADVVGDGRTVWVDLDVADGLRVLEPVDPPPSLVVTSGIIRSGCSQLGLAGLVGRRRHVFNGGCDASAGRHGR